MRGIFYEYVSRIFSARKKHRRFINIMLILSVLAAADVFWTLHRIGIAMTDEFLCGKTEHVHSAECLSDNINGCELEEHTHTAECTSDISADVETEEVWLSTLPVELSDNWRDNMTAIALSQIGYKESERNFTVSDSGERKGYTRYGQWYGNPYGDWNTMFVYFCMYYAGIDTDNIPYGSGCPVWAETLSENGMFIPADIGRPLNGDVCFLDSDKDGVMDKTAVITGSEETDSGLSILAAEGDVNGEVAVTSYLWGDERIIGLLSLDKVNEDIFDDGGNEDVSAELPDYPVYLANRYDTYVYVNGDKYDVTDTSPKSVSSAKKFEYKIILDKVTDDGNYNKNACFKELSEEEYDEGLSNSEPALKYRYFQGDGRYFYSDAFTDKHGRMPPLSRRIEYIPSTGKAAFLLEGKFEPPSVGEESYEVRIRYNLCGSVDGSDKPSTYIKVEAPQILMLSPVYGYNKSQEQADAYVAEVGDKLVFQAKADFEKSGSAFVDSMDYERTEEEVRKAMVVRTLKDGRIIKTYARFQSFGYRGQGNPAAWNDPRVDKGDGLGVYELSADGKTITVTFTVNIKHAEVDYRYNKVEFYPTGGYSDGDEVWLDFAPVEITSTLKMVKNPAKEECEEDYSAHNSTANAVNMETWEYITLKGTTKYFDTKTESEYELLTPEEQRKYIKVAITANSYYYLKTDAKFWSYDEKKDANGRLKSTLLRRDSTRYEVKGSILEIYAEYTAKESDSDAFAKITFYDGTPTNVEWAFYKDFYVKDKKSTRGKHNVYIKVGNDWKDINMITEYNDKLRGILPDPNAYGYIDNSTGNPYIFYVENDVNIDKIELRIPKITYSDGRPDDLAFSRFEYYPEDVPDETLSIESQQQDADMLYVCCKIDGEYINNDRQDECFTNVVFTSGGEIINTYIKLFPRHRKNVALNNSNDVLNHCDIEISDDGIYTTKKTVELPNGQIRETYEIYESVVSGVESCDVYDENGARVERCGREGGSVSLSDDEKYAKFSAEHYISSGTPGSTQFEFTSAYKSYDFTNNTWEELQDIYFLRRDVHKVEFVVQITLTPHKRIISYKDKYGFSIEGGSEQIITGDPITVNKVKLTMDRKDVEAALNKCPTHTGLDFTYNGDLNSENGIGEIEPAKPFVKVYKKLENDNIEAGQFSFLVTDLTTGDQYTVKNRDLKQSSEDERALGLSIVQLSPQREYRAEGIYRFLIQEIIPPEEETNGIIYSEAEYIMEIKVTYKEKEEYVKDTNGNNVLDENNQPVTRLKRYFYYEPSYYSANDIQLKTYNKHNTPIFVNTKFWYTLPSTGGTGITIYYVTGGVLIIVPIVILMRRKRKER